jgi:hypothetical protein
LINSLKHTNGVRYRLSFKLIFRKKKDFSTAILERKKAPNKLTCEEAKNDDNSVIEMT